MRESIPIEEWKQTYKTNLWQMFPFAYASPSLFSSLSNKGKRYDMLNNLREDKTMIDVRTYKSGRTHKHIERKEKIKIA